MTSSPPGPDVTGALIRERLERQRLIGQRFAGPAEAVAWFGAVQSQLFAGAAWAIAQRCDDVSEAGFRELFDSGALVRTHVLRPTWHFVAPRDLRWMLALTAPQVHATSAFYYRKGGLDDDVFRRCADVIAEALAGQNYLTRNELAEALGRRRIPAEGNRLAYIVMWCELEALICSGPMRGRQHTYALVEERVPPAPIRSRDWSLAELARRYFSSHGPAQVRDFAWWAGLRLTEARKAIKLAGEDLKRESIDGAYFFSGLPPADGDPAHPAVHLLPNYDEFVVAYQDRSALFASTESAGEFGGMEALTNNLVLAAGQVIGTWKPLVKAGRVEVAVVFSRAADSEQVTALRAAAERYGRFAGLPVDLRM